MIIIIDTTKGIIKSPKYPDNPVVKSILDKKIKEVLSSLTKKKVTYLKIDEWGVLLDRTSFKSIAIQSA
ncbi:hypothetical protein GTO87_03630 [Ligilactobacillus saerimneri]|uniref:Uncharacterized protein n=1 Tax=Ligilactobacillus saerimneri TaxID=228229 RepID=A0A7H9EJI5_9LACO|nr:hypothetical protein [Ligilactobacillus saerimneri]QLL77771.1 hypothetical protein GTO87_03630 [Ligilactobacillus saerimneri]